MLTKEKAENVAAMISKECCRISLVELCDYWDITPEDYDEFLEYAFRYIDLQE